MKYTDSLVSNGVGVIGQDLSKLKWIIVALGIIGTLAWLNRFPDGMIFAGGDVVQYFNRDWVERNLHYIWSNSVGVGEGGFSPIFLYYPFYAALFAISDVLGLSSSQQPILYMFFFWGGAYVGCLFGLSLISSKKFNVWSLEASLIALIYAINPYTFYAFYFIWGYSPFLFLYVVFPVIAVATIEFFSANDKNRSHILLGILFFTHILATIAYANLPFFIGLNLVLIGLVTVAWLIDSNRSSRSFLLKLALYLAIELVATSWATLPQLPHLLFEANPLNNKEIFDFAEWVLWQRMSFWEIFSLNPAASAYMKGSPFPAIMGFIIIGLAIWSRLATSNKRNTTLQALALMVIVLLIILLETKGKGIVPGAGAVWAFSNPLLGALRSNGKLLIFLPFLLLYIFMLNISSLTKPTRSLLLGCALFTSSISVYPMFIGGLQNAYSAGFNSGQNCNDAEYCYLNRIPDEYVEAAEAIKHDGLKGKILSMPYSVINSPGWSNYPAWKHVGADPTLQLFSLPVVQMNAYNVFGYPYGLKWVESDFKDSEWILQFSANLGVSYFLFHKDVRKDFIDPAAALVRHYEQRGWLTKVYDSRVVTAYRVSEEYRRPAVTLQTNQFPSLPLPLDFVKVDPTKYVVMMDSSQANTSLELREAFSRQWRVYLLPREKLKSSAAETAGHLSWWEPFFLSNFQEHSHTRFAEYGNEWKFDMKEICEQNHCTGDKSADQVVGLLIEYGSQRYIYALLIFSALVGTIGTVIAFRGWLRN